MRRRSERKKSTDVSSPAPASRRTNRRSRQSPSVSDIENKVEEEHTLVEKKIIGEDAGNVNTDASANSADECKESSKRGRNSRCSISSSRKRTRKDSSENSTIPSIAEESLAAEESKHEEKIHSSSNSVEAEKEECQQKERSEPDVKEEAGGEKDSSVETTGNEVIGALKSFSPKEISDEKLKTLDVLEIQADTEVDAEKDKTEDTKKEERNSEEESNIKSTSRVVDADEQNITELSEETNKTHSDIVEFADESNSISLDYKEAETKKEDSPNEIPSDLNKVEENITNNNVNVDKSRIRKRRWLSKKVVENSAPAVFSISSDSLKNIIADVHPVPLSDVHLESSSEVEEVSSEREEGEQTPTPERPRADSISRRRISADKPSSKLADAKLLKRSITNDSSTSTSKSETTVTSATVNAFKTAQRSPSPARNTNSSVLYITNLVRPFTVLQLKGLLARTGKIVENGFWIDRIKSKCYVQYETEDEAIETRHALHGVRWPVSNPKCLNVDFGSKSDMDRAIQATLEEVPKFGQETQKDNVLVGTGWTRDRMDEEKKSSRHVREWDVGKKENLDREKDSRRRSRERATSRNRENDRSSREERKHRSRERDIKSESLSPARKLKKKEEPPLRLLDDLFRKTKATPCVYWLPLTPEQIAEKEAFRQKRIEEHKQRIKVRELERAKEREKEKERNRGSDRERDRGRDNRRNRSSERRRSRSRDRRRY